MSNLENAKKLFDKIDEINTLEEDPRLSKDELNALALNPLISNANWDLLKAMRGGVHHKQEFDCRGIKVYLRMLCSEEEEEILTTLMMKGLVPNGNGLWERHHMKLTLSKASTPHPDLKIGEAPLLSDATLNRMTIGQIGELCNAYTDFVVACNVNLDILTEKEIKELIEILEKKPLLWKDLPYAHREQVTIYLIEQCKILKELRGNLTTQS